MLQIGLDLLKIAVILSVSYPKPFTTQRRLLNPPFSGLTQPTNVADGRAASCTVRRAAKKNVCAKKDYFAQKNRTNRKQPKNTFKSGKTHR